MNVEVTAFFVLLAAGVAAYLWSQRNSRRLVEKVREATNDELAEWPLPELRRTRSLLEPLAAARGTEEQKIRYGYQLGRVQELIRQKEEIRVQQLTAEVVADEEKRQGNRK